MLARYGCSESNERRKFPRVVDDVIGAPFLDWNLFSEIAPGCCDGWHAGGATGDNVAQIVAHVNRLGRLKPGCAAGEEQGVGCGFGACGGVAADDATSSLIKQIGRAHV